MNLSLTILALTKEGYFEPENAVWKTSSDKAGSKSPTKSLK